MPRAGATAIRDHSARKASTSASLVCGPKLMRRKPLAIVRVHAHRGQDGAFLHLARRAGAAGRDRDPGEIELHQQRRAGRAGQRNGADGRQPRAAPRRLPRRRLPSRPRRAVARNAAMPVHVVGPRGKRGGEGQRARRILRAAPIALLLPADRLQRPKVLDQQGADAGRSAQLVGRQGDEIGVGQRLFAGALGAVGEQQRPRLADLRRDAVQRLEDAGFVVDLLDRDQRRTLGKDRVERRLVDQPVRADRNDLRSRAHRMRARWHVRSRHGRGPALRARAATISIASLAPLVKMTS